MLNTRFSDEELTTICQILKRHGTDCATLVEVIRVANVVAPNDAGASFKHIRLLKEFGIIQDKDILCHTCINEAIENHNRICEEHKVGLYPCPDEHYNWTTCEPAVWKVEAHMIYTLEKNDAKKDYEEGRRADIHMSSGEPVTDDKGNVVKFKMDVPRFTHYGLERWLAETFPDVEPEIRWNPSLGFLCEKHIGSMRPYANRITGYR